MQWFRRFAGRAALGFTVVLAACNDDATTGVAPGVVALRIAPRDTSILYGSTMRLVVVAVGPNGNAVPRQPAIEFDIDPPDIVTVDRTGLVTTQRGGTVTVTARLAENPSDERIAQATVRVGFNTQ